MAGQMSRESALEKLAEPAEECPESTMNLFLRNIKMSKGEFDNYIDMGPRHLQYYSPSIAESLTQRVLHFRNAGQY